MEGIRQGYGLTRDTGLYTRARASTDGKQAIGLASCHTYKAHTHTHTHTYTHIYTHTHIHKAHIHAYTYTQGTHTRIHARAVSIEGTAAVPGQGTTEGVPPMRGGESPIFLPIKTENFHKFRYDR